MGSDPLTKFLRWPLLHLSDEAVLLEVEVLFHHAVKLEAEMLVHGNITFFVGFKGSVF